LEIAEVGPERPPALLGRVRPTSRTKPGMQIRDHPAGGLRGERLRVGRGVRYLRTLPAADRRRGTAAPGKTAAGKGLRVELRPQIGSWASPLAGRHWFAPGRSGDHAVDNHVDGEAKPFVAIAGDHLRGVGGDKREPFRR
jgi:hypothetical protein